MIQHPAAAWLTIGCIPCQLIHETINITPGVSIYGPGLRRNNAKPLADVEPGVGSCRKCAGDLAIGNIQYATEQGGYIHGLTRQGIGPGSDLTSF